MMDVREKLVELICRFCSGLAVSDITQPYGYENLADFMISNGVTVQEDCKECAEATQNCIVKLQEQIAELRSAQEWVSVKDRLPEESGMYIVTANDGHAQRVSFVQWQKKNRMWNLTAARSYWRVTHWMPLPEPPEVTP